MALSGKQILITGGAGFIGTTLARRLVDANEIVAFDNLHRDALSRHRPRRAPELPFVQGDVLDRRGLTRGGARARRTSSTAPAIAGVDTVLAEPGADDAREHDRHLQRARGRRSRRRTRVERLVEFSTSEVFGTHAFNVGEGQVTTIGSVGEARWTYAVSKLAGEHMAHAYHDELGLPTVVGAPVQRLRARARSAAARSARSSRRRSPAAT